MPDVIPKTKEAALSAWATDAYRRISEINDGSKRVQDAVRRVIQDGKLRGKTEKRLEVAVERLEDAVDLLSVILLGPDVSQEERDADFS
jgi:hypothetical protein